MALHASDHRAASCPGGARVRVCSCHRRCAANRLQGPSTNEFVAHLIAAASIKQALDGWRDCGRGDTLTSLRFHHRLSNYLLWMLHAISRSLCRRSLHLGHNRDRVARESSRRRGDLGRACRGGALHHNARQPIEREPLPERV